MRLRAKRDNKKVDAVLSQLLKAAQSKDNLMPYIADSVEAYATVGEISNTLRESFGKFRPLVAI